MILIISLFKGFCRNFDLKKHTRRLHDGGVGEDETEAAAGLSLEATANLALEASNHVHSLVGHARVTRGLDLSARPGLLLRCVRGHWWLGIWGRAGSRGCRGARSLGGYPSRAGQRLRAAAAAVR